jgi:hypothetical protein
MNARALHVAVINVLINVAVTNAYALVDLVANSVNLLQIIARIITARTEQRVSMEQGITRVNVPTVTEVKCAK